MTPPPDIPFFFCAKCMCACAFVFAHGDIFARFLKLLFEGEGGRKRFFAGKQQSLTQTHRDTHVTLDPFVSLHAYESGRNLASVV